jgi:type II secretory pathway pseudopilin PulG
MAGLMVVLAIMLIFSTIAFQEWHEELRRDNEAEMMFRAQDLVRAIQRYRKDRGTTPAKLEELMEAGPRGQYYLRKQWEDPLVKGGKWGLLFAGPGGTILDPSAQGQAIEDQLAALGGLSQEDRERLDQMRGGSTEETLDRRRQHQQGQTGGERGAAGAGGPGGLRIAGVKSLCTDDPFRVYKGFDQYNQWLFTYLDLERLQVPGQEAGGRGGRTPGVIRPDPNAGVDRNRDRNRGAGRDRNPAGGSRRRDR